MLGSIDFTILALYFVVITVIGVWFTRKAGQGVGEYFLGGRQIPWYILGISGVATFIDMSGTMLQTSFFYMLGVKGYWVAWRGAIALMLAFLMIFMGKWLNRCQVMTNAELTEFRFGTGPSGRASRALTATGALAASIPILAYFFVGTGKFLSGYFPFSPAAISCVVFAIMLIYTMASGFYGVVYTDLFQSLLILVAIIFVTVKAMTIGTPEYYAQYAPAGWTSLMPSWHMEMPAGYENMSFFGLLLVFWIFSNVLQGFGLPFDAWTAQRYYAAKNERESSLVAGFWIVLFSLRFPMMIGVGVLALSLSGSIIDPEMAFPAVFSHYFPAGIKGLMLAALIAAQLSSVCTVVNAPAGYFVNDLYRPFFKPNASEKHLVRASYATTVAMVIVGGLIGWQLPNINDIWAWIMMGLFTGILAPNILKWFWWRFNGPGYSLGMAGGLIGALAAQIVLKGAAEYVIFSIVLASAFVGSIIGTYLGSPTDITVLEKFFRAVRPFGAWGPVRARCSAEFLAKMDKENHRDLLLLPVACLWQAFLFWTMTCLVIKRWGMFALSAAAVALLSLILYRYWYKNLPRAEEVTKESTPA